MTNPEQDSDDLAAIRSALQELQGRMFWIVGFLAVITALLALLVLGAIVLEVEVNAVR